MSTGLTSKKFAGAFFLCLSVVGLGVGSVSPAVAAATHSQKKAKKPQLPPLPSGPTGPVQQIPLDSIAPVAPQVNYQNGQLTIVAPNSTLGDILRAVRKQTGAEIEVPDAKERVVTHLGPGPAREVVAELLNGSRFNYVLLGSPADASLLTRVVLVAKSGPDNVNQNNPAGPETQQGTMQPGNLAPPPQDMAADANDAEAQPEENQDENADQNAAAEAEQQQPPPDQPGIKTPQQMLQEMQQRQLQLQQNQPPGQPPIPGTGMPQGVPPRPQEP
jgi:hypothetical protein